MPTLRDFAEEYANCIRSQRENNPILSREIALRIKGLSYTKTGESLSKEDKENILQELENLLGISAQSTGSKPVMIKNAEDSTNFIAMVQQIRSELNQK
jgi:ribosome-binding protein aMBF1 (putative translation factor)